MSAFRPFKFLNPRPARPVGGQTSGVAWLTVLLGTPILVGNVVELGGVQPAAREWTAWLLAALVVVHGVGLAWRWRLEDAELRLPRWPLWGLPLVVGLGLVWWWDQATPLQSGQTFFLATEAWLFCWVVAATPGNRALSWAWLMVVVAAASIALLVAVGWQAPAGGRWLPMARQLPLAWQGYWSGTLPWPAAFGALMLMAGAPLLVMAWSGHLPLSWRMLSLSLGLAMLLAAFQSYSMGVWFGCGYVLVMLPWVAAGSRAGRWAGGVVSIMGLALAGWLLHRAQKENVSVFDLLTAGGTPIEATRYALAEAWRHNPWLGGVGASVAEWSRASGLPQPEGGWSYGFSDWLELTVAWGMGGLGLAAITLGGLLNSAWSSWARLPFSVEVAASEEGATSPPAMGASAGKFFTPETKVLLGAGTLGLSAFVVAMAASRAMQFPAVAFVFAILAGVLARNVPQRGGSVRLEPFTRVWVCLGLAALAAFFLIAKVAPTAVAQMQLDEANSLLARIDEHPNAELITQAEVELRAAVASNAVNGPALTDLAWLWLEWARLDPAQFTRYSQMAESDATRAAAYTPRAPEPWIVRGLACLLANRGADAAAHLNHALEVAPRDPEAQYYATTVLLGDIRPENGPPMLRMLPPRYSPPPPWPPLDGEPAGAVAAPQ